MRRYVKLRPTLSWPGLVSRACLEIQLSVCEANCRSLPFPVMLRTDGSYNPHRMGSGVTAGSKIASLVRENRQIANVPAKVIVITGAPLLSLSL